MISLLVLPACRPSVEEGDDPRKPDGGEPDKIESSCRAAYSALYGCYEELGYASSGGASGSSGSYDRSEYVDEVCANVDEYAGADGPACAGAYEEVFACLASLDCNAISQWQGDDDSFAPEPCQAVFLDASERCPEGFGTCATYTSSSGPGCDQSAASCLDGNTYRVRCSEPGATQSCECERNGEVFQTVTVAGDLECGSEELFDELNDACGFPPGVF